MSADLSPALELAVRMIAKGETIKGWLCMERPDELADIELVSMGIGYADANGGLFTVTRKGWIECIAYDVRGALVVSTPSYCPLFGRVGQTAKVGPLTMDPKVSRQ